VKRGLLLLVVTVASALAAAPAQASCALSVKLNGTAYVASGLTAADGPALHGGVIPGCNDVIVHDASGRDISPREPDTPVELHRIAGVPARLAVAYNGKVYLAEGYLPALAGHPLHRAWARAATPASSCSKAWHVTATVSVTPTPGPVPVRTAGGRATFLQLASDTKVTGLTVAGYPHLAQGQRIRALVRTCSSPFGGRVLLARTVTRS
jgi:hypothetical protein